MGNRDPGGIRWVLQADWWEQRLDLKAFFFFDKHVLERNFYNLTISTLGIPDDIIEKGRDYKLITEITQDGDEFSWTQVYPTDAKVTNKFTIGKECDMQTIGGKKFKVG